MTDGACVFCRIVAGREPCSRVHEDDISLGFMGIRPARPGELMIIPKEHIDHFCDIPDDLAAHILLVAQRLSRAIRRTLSPPRVGLVVPRHELDAMASSLTERPLSWVRRGREPVA